MPLLCTGCPSRSPFPMGQGRALQSSALLRSACTVSAKAVLGNSLGHVLSMLLCLPQQGPTRTRKNIQRETSTPRRSSASADNWPSCASGQATVPPLLQDPAKRTNRY